MKKFFFCSGLFMMNVILLVLSLLVSPLWLGISSNGQNRIAVLFFVALQAYVFEV